MPYYIYWIFATACYVTEMLTMDFSLICFGTGFLGASLMAWLGLGLLWQIAAFIVVSLALFFGIRPMVLKYLYRTGKDVKMNVDALVGRIVVVQTAPDEQDHIGRVETDGDNWRAFFKAPAQPGERVQVEKIDGNTLFVVPVELKK